MKLSSDGDRDAGRVREILEQAQESASVRRIYGKPVERDGVIVIPAASIIGGGGGGSGDTGAADATDRDVAGDAPDDGVGGAMSGSGSGGGFGVIARPVGAYVIRDGEARWRPAFDVNRFVFWGHMVAIVYFLVRWRIERARSRAR